MSLEMLPGGDGCPPEPDWRTIFSDTDDIAVAHEEWGNVIRDLREAATLAVANGSAIRRLVDFRVQYERASRHVAENGAVMRTSNKKAKVGQWNPYWAVLRHADEHIRANEAELGIAPVRRGKAVKVQRAKKATRPSDQYLRPTAV
jgi:P27 family predicted phage terminase small subunit